MRKKYEDFKFKKLERETLFLLACQAFPLACDDSECKYDRELPAKSDNKGPKTSDACHARAQDAAERLVRCAKSHRFRCDIDHLDKK